MRLAKMKAWSIMGKGLMIAEFGVIITGLRYKLTLACESQTYSGTI